MDHRPLFERLAPRRSSCFSESGGENAKKEIMSGAAIGLPKIVFPIMKYVTPIYLIILLGFWLFQDGIRVLTMRDVPSENYAYIWFARFLLAGILVAILVLVRIAWQRKHRIQQRIPA